MLPDGRVADDGVALDEIAFGKFAEAVGLVDEGEAVVDEGVVLDEQVADIRLHAVDKQRRGAILVRARVVAPFSEPPSPSTALRCKLMALTAPWAATSPAHPIWPRSTSRPQ